MSAMKDMPTLPPLPRGHWDNGRWIDDPRSMQERIQQHLAVARANKLRRDLHVVPFWLIAAAVAYGLCALVYMGVPWLVDRLDSNDLPDCPSGHYLGEQCLPVGITNEEVDRLIFAQRDEPTIQQLVAEPSATIGSR